MEKWMTYTEGDQVRYSRTGEFGFVTAVDEINETYTVNINGEEITVTEDELC